ncbi:MAG: hypothetical protein AAGA32_21670 [Pseudomonadota bacterium]
MLETISEQEATPIHAANALEWARIEAYIARRWVTRTVTYIVEGSGEWSPRLYRFTATTTECWVESDDWQTVSLAAAPRGGLVLSGVGPHRIAGSAGDNTMPPADVAEAVARLAAFNAEEVMHLGASSYASNVGPINVSVTRAPGWRAQTLQHSRAASLLRSYRSAL